MAVVAAIDTHTSLENYVDSRKYIFMRYKN